MTKTDYLMAAVFFLSLLGTMAGALALFCAAPLIAVGVTGVTIVKFIGAGFVSALVLITVSCID